MPSSNALPVDLDLHVTTVFRNGKMYFHYILNSEVAGFTHRSIDGPPIQGSPDEYRAYLSEKIWKLGERTNVDDSPLLREEIERKLAALGHDLYRELFSPEMKQAYRRFRRSVTTLTIISEEPWIPWELVKPFDTEDPHDVIDDDFLCVKFELTRWLAGNRSPAPEIAVHRVACFQTSPGLPQAKQECEILADWARTHPGIENASAPITSASEIEALLEKGGFDVLHFVGHGTVAPARPDESALPLPDKSSLHPVDLGGRIETQFAKDRPLVFLNACWIGQQGWSLTGLGGWAKRWGDVCGCGAFLGPSWPVKDSLALEFAKTFYGALAQGDTFGRAAREARLATRKL